MEPLRFCCAQGASDCPPASGAKAGGLGQVSISSQGKPGIRGVEGLPGVILHYQALGGTHVTHATTGCVGLRMVRGLVAKDRGVQEGQWRQMVPLVAMVSLGCGLPHWLPGLCLLCHVLWSMAACNGWLGTASFLPLLWWRRPGCSQWRNPPAPTGRSEQAAFARVNQAPAQGWAQREEKGPCCQWQ